MEPWDGDIAAPPGWAETSRSLERAGAEVAAPECHGILCGLLCTTGGGEESAWLAEVLGETEPGDLLVQECCDLLQRLRDESRRQLYSEDCEFEPLLPDDNQSMAVRSEALRAWCGGFLAGLGLGGVADPAHLPPDSREIITDLSKLALIEIEYEESEGAEAAYTELVEFIRVGVMLVNEELQPARLMSSVGGTVH